MPSCDVAIIGAGPYGLSAAAHLRSCDGLNVLRVRRADGVLGEAHARRYAPALSLGRHTHFRSASRTKTRRFSEDQRDQGFSAAAARPLSRKVTRPSVGAEFACCPLTAKVIPKTRAYGSL